MLTKIAPKKFLCKYPLNNGSIISSILFIIITVLCALILLIEILTMNQKEDCSRFVWKNGYSFSITGIVYSIAMVFVHLWLIWGVKKEKASVVLSWVVMTGMWFAQTFCLLIVLLLMYSTQVELLPWVLSFIFGIVAMCILAYLLLVVFGFWLKIKQNGHRVSV